MKKDKTKFISFGKVKRTWLKNREILFEYQKLKPEFQLAKQVIEARIKKGLSQSQLAQKVGTKQPAISRLESMNGSPSFRLVKKIAQVLEENFKINFG